MDPHLNTTFESKTNQFNQVTCPPYSNKAFGKSNLKKAGFTLTETLITLTIIGVTATLTIPNLISKYKKEVAITKLNKAVSLLKYANSRAIAEYSLSDSIADRIDISANNPQDALKALNTYYAPFIKFKETKALTYGAIGYLEDGTGLYLRKRAECGPPSWYCTHMIICTNLKNCKETPVMDKMINSRDTFEWGYRGDCPSWGFLNIYNKNREKLKQACKVNNGSLRETCSMLICIDGMQIKDDYPLKF